MKEYEQLFSILQIDDKFYHVCVYNWARKTLSSEEYSQFKLDMKKVQDWEVAKVALGQAYAYQIVETFDITTHDKFQIQIGVIYAIDDALELVPEWTYWQNRMQQDSNIVKYNPAVRIN